MKLSASGLHFRNEKTLREKVVLMMLWDGSDNLILQRFVHTQDASYSLYTILSLNIISFASFIASAHCTASAVPNSASEGRPSLIAGIKS